MTGFLRGIVALAALLVLSVPALAEKRVALVIGNGAYKNTIELPNAPSDARAVAGSLRRLGFKVVDGINLTQAQMTGKLKEFSDALVDADVGLFFYAGHGLQVGGENYLVAVDAALKREADLEFYTMKVDQVLRQMQREAKVKVVILDSCRDNPLAQELTRSMAQSGGSARTRSASVASGMSAIDTSNATGTLIAFATAPGSVALDGKGKNSPFTEALLQHMETPGIDIDVMMKRVRGQVTRSTNERQQPWTNSSLTAEFYMNPVAGGGQQVAALPQNAAPAVQGDGGQSRAATASFEREQALWQEAQRGNTARDYQAYLEAYPNGTFAGLARNRVAAVASTPAGVTGAGSIALGDLKQGEASEATEQRLDLGNKGWREIQTRLSGLGYYNRSIDGEAGPGTRRAVREWQEARGYNSTGFFNEPQHRALLDEKVPDKKSAARSKDDEDEEEAKPRQRNRSAGQSSGSSERRQQQRSNSDAGNVAAGIVGAAIIGGAIGLAVRRRR